MNNWRGCAALVAVLLVTGLLGLAPATAAAEEFDETVVEDVNDERIEAVNADIETINERIENADDLELVDEVDATDWDEAEVEADRLRETPAALEAAMFDAVVDEINARAQETPLGKIANDVSSPDEARAEADRLRDDYGTLGGEDIEEAAQSLETAADLSQSFEEKLLTGAGELTPPETGTLEGTVTDDDGDPLAGIDVDIVGSSAATTTGDDGQFELETPAGEQSIHVEADGYEPSDETVDIATDEAASVEMTLSEADDDSVETTDGDSISGFGLAVTVGTILAVVGLGFRRRH
ncbi:carboxypeptidase regulatory-like domain-containing protein [Natrarchaeobaculum sulfurireducens]|uniref:carboxypeptidase regulatory-like domain-containing protein n=1 Tax=Natrarchaeobaculum sulfurireducens TaxID=2044521 RepID=UPI000E3E753F|nr:carboxypeptidase regulatory-like domain-containing protein [Natrarchaeobaculum sulfurireducens]